jgi:hypothetical protein
MLLPDGVTRERAITVLKMLAAGKYTRLTADLSGETKATVAALLDLCPDPSPRGIRAVVRQLEDGARARPEPIRGPIPPLTPATPRAVGGIIPPGPQLLVEPDPPELVVGVTLPEPSITDQVVAQLAGDYIADLEAAALPAAGLAISVDLLPGPHTLAVGPAQADNLVDEVHWDAAADEALAVVEACLQPEPELLASPPAVGDVDRLVERVQQHRPALAAVEPATEDAWDGSCSVCSRPVNPEWAARTGERVHFTHALLAARREASG